MCATELVAIARELRRRVEWFVDPGPPSIVSYRASKPGIAVQAIDTELDRIVRDVEFVTGESPGLIQDVPEVAARPQTLAEADALAVSARAMLGLRPDAPAHDLADLVAGIGLLPFAIVWLLLNRGFVGIYRAKPHSFSYHSRVFLAVTTLLFARGSGIELYLLTYLFALPGSSGAVRDGWDGILATQLDSRHRPCNFVELMPRLRER